jgi:hypothetical protein
MLPDDLTLTDRGRTPPLVVNAKRVEERKGYNMTMEEKIKVHVQIERENRRKVEEWKKGGKHRVAG